MAKIIYDKAWRLGPDESKQYDHWYEQSDLSHSELITELIRHGKRTGFWKDGLGMESVEEDDDKEL